MVLYPTVSCAAYFVTGWGAAIPIANAIGMISGYMAVRYRPIRSLYKTINMSLTVIKNRNYIDVLRAERVTLKVRYVCMYACMYVKHDY